MIKLTAFVIVRRMEAAVRIQKLTVTVGKDFRALNNVTVDLPAGKIIGLIGPSGAGKTTLIRSIVGRQKLTAGTISLFGLTAGDKRLRQTVSYMTQEISVYPDLTVQENIDYFATMFGIPRRMRAAEVSRLIDTVDLRPQSEQIVDKLSGGQKQRVSLAIALIGKPKLMVLDEPTVGLDPLLREQLWVLFRKLSAEGMTIIVSSHVMDEAERCDELLLIRNGQILAQGSPQELCNRTNTDSVEQSFLALVGETAGVAA